MFYISTCTARHILASLHFNENLRRNPKKRKESKPYMNVTYPKFKMGKEVVREVAEPPRYGMYMDSNLHCISVYFSSANTAEAQCNSIKANVKKLAVIN